MPKRIKQEEFAALGKKDCWQLYGLQVLSPGKFVSVVEKVLKGQCSLVNAPRVSSPDQPSLKGLMQ
jgi:hypothetical protein